MGLSGVSGRALDAFNPNVSCASGSAAVDRRGRAMGAVIPGSQSTCRSFRSVNTSPKPRRGPAYWMRCVVARTIDAGLPEGPLVVYLPGVARSELRAADTLPAGPGADRRAAVPESVVLAPKQP